MSGELLDLNKTITAIQTGFDQKPDDCRIAFGSMYALEFLSQIVTQSVDGEQRRQSLDKLDQLEQHIQDLHLPRCRVKGDHTRLFLKAA